MCRMTKSAVCFAAKLTSIHCIQGVRYLRTQLQACSFLKLIFYWPISFSGICTIHSAGLKSELWTKKLKIHGGQSFCLMQVGLTLACDSACVTALCWRTAFPSPTLPLPPPAFSPLCPPLLPGLHIDNGGFLWNGTTTVSAVKRYIIFITSCGFQFPRFRHHWGEIEGHFNQSPSNITNLEKVVIMPATVAKAVAVEP